MKTPLSAAALLLSAGLLVAPAVLLLAACGGPAQTNPPATAPAASTAPLAPVGADSKAPALLVTQTATPQQLVFPEAEAFRSAQPAAAALHAFRLPKVQYFKAKDGVAVYLVEQHSLPIVSMDLNFDGGARLDPKGKDGAASLCMGMLTEGTERLDKIQYAEALADVASNINAYATDDTAGITLSSLSKRLRPTFELFVEALRSPGFRPSDFERQVKRNQEAIRQSKGNPASVADRVSDTVLYGPSHPYGAVVTEQSLAAIGIEDCKRFVAKQLKPHGARLFVVGDLDAAGVRAYLEQAELASWQGAVPTLPAPPAPKSLGGRVFFVNIPGAAQSQVSFMHFGPQRTARDYFANTLMAAVFGGGFAGRINMNLREDKGYSYGARGGFRYTKEYGVFGASASVRTDSTYQTLLEIERELEDLSAAHRPVTQAELEREKQGTILSLPAQFATEQAALLEYRKLVYYGLPLDYFDSFAAHVSEISEAQVKASAAKRLKPAQGVYLVVGDGDAKVILRDPTTHQDVPYLEDGQQLSLRQALADLAGRPEFGRSHVVELDTDGHPI